MTPGARQPKGVAPHPSSLTVRTIRHYVDHRAREQPEAPYLIVPETDATLTYGDLATASHALGGYLLGLGLGKGDKIALMLHNGYQTGRLLIGLMYAGFVAVPLNLLAHSSQLEYVLDHSDVELVFTSRDLEARLRAALANVRRDVRVIVIDPDVIEFLDRAKLPATRLPDVGEDDEALLMYTSGTTGKPKGVLHTHRSVVAGGEYTSEAHRLTATDRVLCALPLYHINGQIVTAVAPLIHGGSIVMPDRFSVGAYWQQVAQYQCTWINVVPTMISYLLEGAEQCVDLGAAPIELLWKLEVLRAVMTPRDEPRLAGNVVPDSLAAAQIVQKALGALIAILRSLLEQLHDDCRERGRHVCAHVAQTRWLLGNVAVYPFERAGCREGQATGQ